MMHLVLCLACGTHSINESCAFYFYLYFERRTLAICNTLPPVHRFSTLSLGTCGQASLGHKELNIANLHSCCPLGSASSANVPECKASTVCRAPRAGGWLLSTF